MEATSEPPQFTLKFVMLGDAGTGKTALSSRFTKGTFSPTYAQTDRLQFSSKEFAFTSLRLKAQIWDTAGKDRPEGMTRAYFKDAVGAVLVYNVNDRRSFDHIQNIWMPQMMAFGPPTMPKILVANKVDGGDAPPRVVSSEEGIKLAHEHSCSYLETSALADYNVDAMFRRLIFSVASVLPGIRVSTLAEDLPLGWLRVACGSEGGIEFCNYWTGETTADTPTEPALVYITGKGEMESFVKVEMTFRDSFCKRIACDDTVDDRLSGHVSNPDAGKFSAAPAAVTFGDPEKKNDSSGPGVGCGQRCTVS